MKDIKLEDGTIVSISDEKYAELKEQATPEFKVGDWVEIHTDNEHSCNQVGDIGRVVEKSATSNAYRIEVFGRDGRGNKHGVEYLKPASDQQVRIALVTEAERRGFKKGVRFIQLSHTNPTDRVAELGLDHPGVFFIRGLSGNNRFNMALCKAGGLIYHGETDTWAKIVYDSNKVDLNDDYTAVIASNGMFVKVGCHQFSFEKVEELYNQMKKMQK